MIHPLSGVYAAAVTPLKPDGSIDAPAIVPLLDFLARRGCHGALLFGTTGEGPSFAPDERIELCRAALPIRESHPDFKLLLGAGTPSLEETIALTRAAFDLGLDGVVTLPPYYFRKASDDGLFAWFAEVIQRAVPGNGFLFGYHIPSVSGVGLSFDLLARLKDSFPTQFAGLKDSSADTEHGRLLGERFADDLLIFCGTDPLFQNALRGGASGCITAPANLFSPELRQVWEAHASGGDAAAAQKRLETMRPILDRYPPASATLKALLSRMHGLPRFAVRPPLLPISHETEEAVVSELEAAGLIN
ncbi:MAG: dihydrodipicolinate synthase family protein [Chloroflexi bacterium]|nr:dihydrodipicolinate synthase family protein [Chloroflexota bacterium]